MRTVIEADGREYYLKYLKAIDFIEMLIAVLQKSSSSNQELIQVFINLIDLVDFKMAASLLLKFNQEQTFLELERLCQSRGKHLERDQLIQ